MSKRKSSGISSTLGDKKDEGKSEKVKDDGENVGLKEYEGEMMVKVKEDAGIGKKEEDVKVDPDVDVIEKLLDKQNLKL